MGLFDYLQCDKPLPDGYKPKGQPWDFQTDFSDDPYMERYRITEDGRLLHREQCYDITPLEERDKFDADGTRWVEVPHHGDVYFGSFIPETKEKHEYVARFTHGRLESIKCQSE